MIDELIQYVEDHAEDTVEDVAAAIYTADDPVTGEIVSFIRARWGPDVRTAICKLVLLIRQGMQVIKDHLDDVDAATGEIAPLNGAVEEVDTADGKEDVKFKGKVFAAENADTSEWTDEDWAYHKLATITELAGYTAEEVRPLRNDVGNLRQMLAEFFQGGDMLWLFAEQNDETVNGVDFRWVNGICHIDGDVPIGTTNHVIYNGAVPEFMFAGMTAVVKVSRFEVQGAGDDVKLFIIWQIDGSDPVVENYSGNGTTSVPNNATGLIMGISVPNSSTYTHLHCYLTAGLIPEAHFNGDAYADGNRILTENDVQTLLENTVYYRGQLPNGDLNNTALNTLYMVSSTGTYQNLPANSFSGLLYTIGGSVKVQYGFNFGNGSYYYRSYTGGSWRSWSRPEYQADVEKIAYTPYYRGGLPNGDLNDVAVNTLYLLDTSRSYSHLPEDNFAGILYTIGAGIKIQYALKFSNGAYWYRRYTAGSWSAWSRPEYQADVEKIALTPYYRGGLSNGDLNNVAVNTLYLLDSSRTYDHLPESNFSGILYTIGAGVKIQYALEFNRGSYWYRRYTGGSWSEWSRPEYNTSNEKGKIYVKCNSILAGSVHTYKSASGAVKYDHLAAWGNAPYSVIAKRIGADQTGINNNILLSSTGVLWRATDWVAQEGTPSGSFLDNIIGGTFTQRGETVTIQPADLSSYDYLLTHFWIGDLKLCPIGSPNESAVTDEALADYDAALSAGTLTLVGGVKRLLQYLQNNSPHCRLVLVSVPPVDTSIPIGDNPFMKQYADSGVAQTIAQLDTVMHSLSETEHFRYIDWQDFMLSYYYQKYTGATISGNKINNVHANNENTYRQMGEYLAEHI